MARHTRDMIRHHRERVIAKRTGYFRVWFDGWVPDHGLSKYAGHHHKCGWCTTPFKRSMYNWRDDPDVYQSYYYDR